VNEAFKLKWHLCNNNPIGWDSQQASTNTNFLRPQNLALLNLDLKHLVVELAMEGHNDLYVDVVSHIHKSGSIQKRTRGSCRELRRQG
jgi:hypothetical protein